MSNNKSEQPKPDETAKQEYSTDRSEVSPPDMDYWDDIVGQRVNEAVRKGMFDNLKGKGKPLKLRGNPLAGDRQLAYDIMEDNDLAPDWIWDRKGVQQAIGSIRSMIQEEGEIYTRAFDEAKDELRREQIRQQWRALVSKWQEMIVKLNDQIQTLNFKQPPVFSLEIIKLRLADELKRAGVSDEIGVAPE